MPPITTITEIVKVMIRNHKIKPTYIGNMGIINTKHTKLSNLGSFSNFLLNSKKNTWIFVLVTNFLDNLYDSVSTLTCRYNKSYAYEGIKLYFNCHFFQSEGYMWDKVSNFEILNRNLRYIRLHYEEGRGKVYKILFNISCI